MRRKYLSKKITYWLKINESILVTIKALVSIDLDFFVYHGGLIHFDNPDQFVINYNWNDHYAWAEDHATFEVEYEIVVDKDFQHVVSEEGHVQRHPMVAA